MIRTFINQNNRAIKYGLIWMSIIFTSLPLIVFTILYFKDIEVELSLFLTVIFSAGIAFPIIGTLIAFLRWSWDNSIITRNFNSTPFNQLESSGFKMEMLNQVSKWNFTRFYLTGMINDFIVDCDINTQQYSKYLIFKFYINHKRITKEDYKRMRNMISKQNGLIDFNWIGKKYHYKKHGLKTLSDLEKELFEFSVLILKENIEPFKTPN